MRPKVCQLGIVPEFTTQGPPDYFGKATCPLSRAIVEAARHAGAGGVTASELAVLLGKSLKSIAGRVTELVSQERLRVTEARRDGRVYVATERDQRYA